MIPSTATLLILLLLIFSTLQGSDEAKILGIFPLASKSHMAVNLALLKELARRGHHVTVLNPLPESESIPNYKLIKLKEINLEDLFGSKDEEESKPPNPFMISDMGYIKMAFFMWTFGNLMCDNALQQEELQQLMKTSEKYDLIVLESFYTDCLIGFAHKLKAPVIQTLAFAGTEDMNDLVGNPSPYSYVPDVFQDFSEKMNFQERLFNTIGQLYQKLGRKFYMIPTQDKIMRKHFNDPNMPSIAELEKNTSLILVNHHFSISSPRPLVPNAIQIGGMHVKAPKKLPADLQKFMDDAPNGVIYFSMGSNLKSSDMPEEVVNAFVQTFSKLKQKVLWKWETESLPGQPPNLKLGKWLPQSDILAHPNVRVFITHGGLLSTQETIYRGVPVVGLPVFGDQKLNMAKSKALGFGIPLDIRNLSEEIITKALMEVLENPKYRENAQRLSKIYRDQPLSPLDTAVFWTEYVIRHKGAPHMRSAALDLCWYQYFLLDVIAVLALASGTVLLVVFIILRTIYRKICSGSKNKNKTSTKKKTN